MGQIRLFVHALIEEVDSVFDRLLQFEEEFILPIAEEQE